MEEVYIPEEILKLVALYSLIPRFRNVSRRLRDIEDSLHQDRIYYMNKRYPSWERGSIKNIRCMLNENNIDAVLFMMDRSPLIGWNLKFLIEDLLKVAIENDNTYIVQITLPRMKDGIYHTLCYSLENRRSKIIEFLMDSHSEETNEAFKKRIGYLREYWGIYNENIYEGQLEYAASLGLTPE